ncbi:hypothetical protein BDV95DRAFT_154720 [Massariosphaeria phaeospora]|uniref:Uncharacterized protein n=1 Tax=Massariosphaeria phaeospora TaxID=100035 RepID=A0A7C8II09_9PLEO|nr:hypothetical protein BDV95DRAFT_154720 [Massariosphaeria phaeospora]
MFKNRSSKREKGAGQLAISSPIPQPDTQGFADLATENRFQPSTGAADSIPAGHSNGQCLNITADRNEGSSTPPRSQKTPKSHHSSSGSILSNRIFNFLSPLRSNPPSNDNSGQHSLGEKLSLEEPAAVCTRPGSFSDEPQPQHSQESFNSEATGNGYQTSHYSQGSLFGSSKFGNSDLKQVSMLLPYPSKSTPTEHQPTESPMHVSSFYSQTPARFTAWWHRNTDISKDSVVTTQLFQRRMFGLLVIVVMGFTIGLAMGITVIVKVLDQSAGLAQMQLAIGQLSNASLSDARTSSHDSTRIETTIIPTSILLPPLFSTLGGSRTSRGMPTPPPTFILSSSRHLTPGSPTRSATAHRPSLIRTSNQLPVEMVGSELPGDPAMTPSVPGSLEQRKLDATITVTTSIPTPTSLTVTRFWSKESVGLQTSDGGKRRYFSATYKFFKRLWVTAMWFMNITLPLQSLAIMFIILALLFLVIKFRHFLFDPAGYIKKKAKEGMDEFKLKFEGKFNETKEALEGKFNETREQVEKVFEQVGQKGQNLKGDVKSATNKVDNKIDGLGDNVDEKFDKLKGGDRKRDRDTELGLQDITVTTTTTTTALSIMHTIGTTPLAATPGPTPTNARATPTDDYLSGLGDPYTQPWSTGGAGRRYALPTIVSVLGRLAIHAFGDGATTTNAIAGATATMSDEMGTVTTTIQPCTLVNFEPERILVVESTNAIAPRYHVPWKDKRNAVNTSTPSSSAQPRKWSYWEAYSDIRLMAVQACHSIKTYETTDSAHTPEDDELAATVNQLLGKDLGQTLPEVARDGPCAAETEWRASMQKSVELCGNGDEAMKSETAKSIGQSVDAFCKVSGVFGEGKEQEMIEPCGKSEALQARAVDVSSILGRAYNSSHGAVFLSPTTRFYESSSSPGSLPRRADPLITIMPDPFMTQVTKEVHEVSQTSHNAALTGRANPPSPTVITVPSGYDRKACATRLFAQSTGPVEQITYAGTALFTVITTDVATPTAAYSNLGLVEPAWPCPWGVPPGYTSGTIVPSAPIVGELTYQNISLLRAGPDTPLYGACANAKVPPHGLLDEELAIAINWEVFDTGRKPGVVDAVGKPAGLSKLCYRKIKVWGSTSEGQWKDAVFYVGDRCDGCTPNNIDAIGVVAGGDGEGVDVFHRIGFWKGPSSVEADGVEAWMAAAMWVYQDDSLAFWSVFLPRSLSFYAHFSLSSSRANPFYIVLFSMYSFSRIQQ